jgi:hypothetical protein
MCAPRAVPDFTCFAHKMHAIAQLQPAILSKGRRRLFLEQWLRVLFHS